MSDVFYLRPISPPIDHADVAAMARQSGGCFDLHRVTWIRSFLAEDGGRMLCWYRAADAESVRLALRQLGSDMCGVWPGQVRQRMRDEGAVPSATWVVAEFEFDASSTGDQLASLRERTDQALVAASLDPELAIISATGTRAVYLFVQTDGPSLDDALGAIEPPPSAIWPCAPLRPLAHAD